MSDIIVNLVIDPSPITIEFLGAGVGTGTVTSVSVVTANGLSGTVATATTTPAITLDMADVLQGIGAVNPVANQMIYFTGLNTAAVTTLTPFARTLLDDAFAFSARDTLELTNGTADIGLNSVEAPLVIVGYLGGAGTLSITGVGFNHNVTSAAAGSNKALNIPNKGESRLITTSPTRF